MRDYKPPFHITDKMTSLIAENGRFRSGGVSVFDGEVMIHMAPPAEFVPEHIQNLFICGTDA